MGIEELLGGMGRGGCGEHNLLKGEDLTDFRAKYVHIADLKPGDKVQWKRGFKDARFPKPDEIAEVLDVFPPKTDFRSGSNHGLDENDFSLVYRDGDGDYQVFSYDSRRFERV